MTKRIYCILLIIAGSGSGAAGQSGGVYLISKSQVQFRSEAPLELINAGSGKLKGALDPTARSFAFTIEMASFDGFNSPLQKEHFTENYIESKKYPKATFSGRIIEEDDFTKEGTYTLRAKGKLNIHGVERERIIKGELTVKKGTIQLKSNFTVLLSDHDIKIPRIVYEKLASEIKVTITADFTLQ
jgi:polyisoprenoid-binding protein YceI